MRFHWFLAIIIVGLLSPAPVLGKETFIAISYHDVRDDLVSDLDTDRVAVGTANLIAQFSWLQEHGYHPVSLDDLLAAREGKSPLPPKAVLLTFDDGFTSLYTRVYPLLKHFQYPAVFAVVGSWLEAGAGESVPYGTGTVSRNRFLSWAQLREMADSGLVEVASHSYDLHRAIPGNPQGNLQPVVVTRRYDEATGAYHTVETHRAVIRSDMQKMVALMKDRLGRAPRCMVWPYGLDNAMAREEARAAGMPMTLVLGDSINGVTDLSRVSRLLIDGNPPLDDFVWQLRNFGKHHDPIRVVHVDLDYLFDEDKAQQKKNLDMLLDRIKAMKINTVYLQAFADPDGDGSADALYFPNRHLVVRDDLFNRVAWQLRTRCDVDVYAWMPTLAFELKDRERNEDLLVQKWGPSGTTVSRHWYPRLSPFHPEARRIIGEIYEDLASHAFFSGLLFHDDAYLSDFEDAGPEALKTYRTWGFDQDMGAIRNDEAVFAAWSRKKTEALAAFTDGLAATVRAFRPDIRTARNLYAVVVSDGDGEKWLGQSLDLFLEHYDYTAIMAMPYLEEARRPTRWLDRLVRAVAARPEGLKKSVFELQTVDWKKGVPVSSSRLKRQMARLQRRGALNFGYYPDDFIGGHPSVEAIRAVISLETYPYRK
ncbi:MAG: poly-beta-1,6-N-acetyl-D-glucosamine N-deacetylase PgaB [bacterium]|nr:poly-beta-1,6-N-acetyl-D-glucosamine N-deacetylase PgaB [bacterium]